MFRVTTIILAIGLLQFGCTSVQRVDTTPEDLQAQIRAGKYLQKGRDVTIFTNEGKEVFFRFEQLANDAIVGTTQVGDQASVPIDDVVGLTSKRLNAGRTIAAVGGGVVGFMVVIYAALAGSAIVLAF